jgi:hypothetical protein
MAGLPQPCRCSSEQHHRVDDFWWMWDVVWVVCVFLMWWEIFFGRRSLWQEVEQKKGGGKGLFANEM